MVLILYPKWSLTGEKKSGVVISLFFNVYIHVFLKFIYICIYIFIFLVLLTCF